MPGLLNPDSGSTELDAERNAPGKRLGDLWCRLMHSSIQWPLHGYYACATCGRLYPVPWANIRGAVLTGTAVPEQKAQTPMSFPNAHSSSKA